MLNIMGYPQVPSVGSAKEEVHRILVTLSDAPIFILTNNYTEVTKLEFRVEIYNEICMLRMIC